MGGNAVTSVARQFGQPSGLLGTLIGYGMARGNGELSRWAVQQVKSSHEGEAGRVAELGPGPGIGLEALLAQFRDAHVWGIDLSPVMLSQARKRNLSQVEAGRLTLIEGNTSALADLAPADIVMANHVLYFWHDPKAEMEQIRGFLRPGGLLAVGYHLRQNMPRMAQKRFPPAGHLLYDSDDDVARLARAAGFSSITHRVKGSAEAPQGRVMLAVA
jgi:SAM-dependent methyltransferase